MMGVVGRNEDGSGEDVPATEREPCPLCSTSESEQVFHINDTCDAADLLGRAAASSTVSRPTTLIRDSVMVTARGIEHADCRYMAVLFAGIEDPDQRIWFCNKCGNGGVLNETQRAIAEVLHMTAVRLKDDISREATDA